MAVDMGARWDGQPRGYEQRTAPARHANNPAAQASEERYQSLAIYLRSVQEGHGEEVSEQVTGSATYAETFWDIYKRGLAMRERVVQDIYCVQEQQKYYPNPFDEIAFSQLRQVRTAASLLGLIVLEGERVTPAHIEYMERWVKANEPARQTPVLSWLVTPGNGEVPLLCLWPANPNWANQIAFAAAATLGYYEVLGGTLHGVGPVTDLVVTPCHWHDRIWTPLLHNYARGLLHLPMHCPAINRCHCNTVLAQLRPHARLSPASLPPLSPASLSRLSLPPLPSASAFLRVLCG